MLTPDRDGTRAEFPPGEFVEHDFDAGGQLVPISRPYGRNVANIVVGIIRNFTQKYPEGMTRVTLVGDPSRELGSLAEPECRRIIAAIDLAEQLRRATRVDCALGRRQDLDGKRHREHGLDCGGAAAPHRIHAARR